jgi:hypothetical protein
MILLWLLLLALVLPLLLAGAILALGLALVYMAARIAFAAFVLVIRALSAGGRSRSGPAPRSS